MTTGDGESGAGRFDERALAEQRLPVLQNEAAAGYFGEPLQFLAGLELEFPISRFQSAQAVDFEAKRRTVHEYVAALEPRNAAEQATKERWLRQAVQFTAVDLINFDLYRAFSVPTLGPTAAPSCVTYESMREYAQRRGAIEFRFGPGMLQRGYYDNPGVSEVRLTPRPPAELEKTDKAVMERLGQIAAEYGYVVALPNRHFNLSVYGQREIDGVTDQWPLINNPKLPEGRGATIDIISGICAAIEDGLPMNGGAINSMHNFSGYELSMPAWQIGPTRRAIRVLQGYVELRQDMALSNSDVVTAQNWLWLMAGMAYGLEQGAAALAASGYQTAEFITRPMAIPTSNYAKSIDLGLLRLIENANFTPDRLLPNKDAPVGAPAELIDRVFGAGTVMGNSTARAFGDLIIGSLESDEAGKLALNPERFVWRHNSPLTSPSEREDMAPFVEQLGLEKIATRIVKFVERDAIRLENREVVTALPSAPRLTQVQQRWEQSPLMRRAYGQDTARYIAHLKTLL